MSNDQYAELGVASDKRSVHRAFGAIISNKFPGAFCNIVLDPVFEGMALVKHPDGDGSKAIHRCLDYAEIGDPTVFRGAVDDALSMNTGDIAAAGFVNGDMFLTDTIAINAFNVDKEVFMKQICIRIEELLQLYKAYKMPITFMGGETADLAGQVKSVVFDMDIFARANLTDIIKGNIQPGDSIFGFCSDGKATWETEENSGIMSNGLTLARNVLVHKNYSDKYPCLSQDNKPYSGFFNVSGELPGVGMTLSQALLSPTRQWAIVIKILIEELKVLGGFHLLHGISMNTGGGATKVGNLGKNIKYCKGMPKASPFFELIQRESEEDWRNMYTSFNCGVGLDIIGDLGDGLLIKAIENTSKKTGVNWMDLGKCEESKNEENEIFLKTHYGDFDYPDE